MIWDGCPAIPIYDERRRPRRDAPAADLDPKNFKHLPAPPCLGEALRRGTLVNLMIFLGRVIMSQYVISDMMYR